MGPVPPKDAAPDTPDLEALDENDEAPESTVADVDAGKPDGGGGEEGWTDVRESWVGPSPATELPVAPIIKSAPKSLPPPLPNPGVMDKRATPPSRKPMQARMAAADWAGASMAAEALLRRDPADAEAAECGKSCRAKLRELYTERLGGSLDRIPQLAMAIDSVVSLTLDVRSGYLLSRIDGLATLEQIVNRGILPPVDSLRVLSELYLHQVIELDDE
jgi:hypothetical protein